MTKGAAAAPAPQSQSKTKKPSGQKKKKTKTKSKRKRSSAEVRADQAVKKAEEALKFAKQVRLEVREQIKIDAAQKNLKKIRQSK